MNIAKSSPAALEKALAESLEGLLRTIDWLHGWKVKRPEPTRGDEFDLVASIPIPAGGTATLFIECKSELRPSAFATLAQRPLPTSYQTKVTERVLALPWVSPRLADLCTRHGWSWFDLAGNCRLSIPGVIHLERIGNPPIHRRPRPTANLGTAEAGRVIRALLLPEHAKMHWTQRSMQNHCKPGVSLGLVNKVVRFLRDEAFIEDATEGFRLRDPLKLLFAWRDAYDFARHERRAYFTLLQGKKLQDALHLLDINTGGFAAYASFSAADFQAPHVRQPRTWLYVRESFIQMFEALAEAKQVESGDNTIVLIPFDDGVFYLADGGTMGNDRLRCTNLVQTYVDLYHAGGRGKEAAEALLDQRLKPEWVANGLAL